MKFERILFPTDFSDHARHAQEYAVSLAREYGAELLVIHVVQLYSYVVDFGMDSSRQFETVTDTLKKLLDGLLDELAAEPFQVSGRLEHGDPLGEIVRVAREESCDLIVMGTHGRGALEHVLLGSVAEKVVRKAPCPVLSVRLPGHVFRMP
jgi:nucleotide-binding universal stress UspA family protein